VIASNTSKLVFTASNVSTSADTSIRGGNVAYTTSEPSPDELKQQALAKLKQEHRETCRTAFKRPTPAREPRQPKPPRPLVPEARVAARRRAGPRG
jgi:hypothetical protein